MTSRRILSLLALPLAASVLLAGCSTTFRPDRFDTDPSTTADDQMAVSTDCALLVPSAADRGFAQVTVDPQYEDDSDLSGIQQAGGTVCFFADPAAATVYHVGVQLIQGNEAERQCCEQDQRRQRRTDEHTREMPRQAEWSWIAHWRTSLSPQITSGQKLAFWFRF